jgi:hypothetical protein
LRRFWYSTLAVISSTSTDERAIRASQWINPVGNEDKDVT